MDFSSSDLAHLFNHYGSDKDRNGYSQLYFTLLNRIRNQELTILEIGIGTLIPDVCSSMLGYQLEGYRPGGSLRAWRDFFPHSRIIGLDVQPDTQFQEDRIETYICNSTDEITVAKFMAQLKGIQFDVIIDDGDHVDISQILTLNNFYPHLKEGGLYVIEDVYPGSNIIVNPQLVEAGCRGDPFFYAGQKSNLCIIYKQHIQSTRMNY